MDENTIASITQQIFAGLELLFNFSFFHGHLSIDNVFIDQNSMVIKLADYGIYNCIYTDNQLEPFEGSKMDLFCVGILILKLLGKLRVNMALDMGDLQYKVPILRSIYK
jgi:serine/threonine protein kinase